MFFVLKKSGDLLEECSLVFLVSSCSNPEHSAQCNATPLGRVPVAAVVITWAPQVLKEDKGPLQLHDQDPHVPGAAFAAKVKACLAEHADADKGKLNTRSQNPGEKVAPKGCPKPAVDEGI